MVLMFLVPHCQAAMSPLGISLFPPVEIPDDRFSITGVRLNLLVGSHLEVYGFDFGGLGNITNHQMVGLQLAGLFNWNKGESTAIGAQLAAIANFNVSKAHLIGVQAAAILNHNFAESTSSGLIIAALNLTEFTKVVGLEIGFFNKAKEVYGFQIGLVNLTENLHGIQIGLLNFNTQGLFSVVPGLNVGF